MKRKRLLLFLSCFVITVLIFAVRHIESGANIAAYFSDPQIITISIEKYEYTSASIEMIGNIPLTDVQQEKLRKHISDEIYVKTTRKYFPITSPTRYKIVAKNENGAQVATMFVIQSQKGIVLWVDYAPGDLPAIHKQYLVYYGEWINVMDEFFASNL